MNVGTAELGAIGIKIARTIDEGKVEGAQLAAICFGG